MQARGFTLIELSMAIAIVGILAGIAIPGYRSQQCRASQTEAMGVLKGLAALEEGYRAEYDRYASAASVCAPSSNPCITYSVKGKKPLFAVSAATSGLAAYTATAIGLTGSSQEGAIWQLDQSGKFTDVTLLCRSVR